MRSPLTLTLKLFRGVFLVPARVEFPKHVMFATTNQQAISTKVNAQESEFENNTGPHFHKPKRNSPFFFVLPNFGCTRFPVQLYNFKNVDTT